MKIRDAVNRGISVLGDSKSSRLNCELLLAHALCRSREHVFAHFSDDVLDEQFESFLKLVNENKSGRPVAYLANSKEFYGLEFYVDERVLIPRPETELIVDAALKLAPDRILDIGTGSGAIAVSLLQNLPKAKCVASDISVGALDVARLNAEKHDVLDRIDFVQSDLIEDITGEFDVICANLPYIGKKDFIDENVKKFEPGIALFSDNLYKKLFQQLSVGRIVFRYLIGEFGFGQDRSMAALLNKNFDHNWEIREDLRGIPRIFIVSV